MASAPQTPPLGFAPMPAVAAVLSRYKPDQLASFIEVAIGLLDVAEPDPDLEEDDPPGQCDEDGINTAYGEVRYTVGASGPGCVCSDSDKGIDDEPHDGEDDMEREQMLDDVPVLPAVTLEHNVFTDQRQPLGLSNLQSSFRTNGGEVRSADTGAVLVTKGWIEGASVPV